MIGDGRGADATFRRAFACELSDVALSLGGEELTEREVDGAIAWAGLSDLMTLEGVAGLDAGDLDRLAKALLHLVDVDIPIERIASALSRSTLRWRHG